MTNEAKLKALRGRRALALHTTTIALVVAALAILGALTHIETGSGAQIEDVHIPTTWLNGFGPAQFGSGEPYVAATGHGLVIRWVVAACFAGAQLFAIMLGFWAWTNKRKEFATPATIIFLAALILSPVPKVYAAGTEMAVSVATAELLLTAKQDAQTYFKLADKYVDALKVYARAQIAFARGDHTRARQLSASLSEDDVQSNIEGPYRLQFLQNRYRGLTTVCFMTVGCLSEDQRAWRFSLFVWIASVLAFVGVALLTLYLLLTRRLALVEALAAQALSIKGAKPQLHPVTTTAS